MDEPRGALRLPGDIILRIFHEFFTAHVRATHLVAQQNDHSLLAFSQTCRVWRTLALQTPSLWNSVPMHRPTIASLCKQRAGSVSIDMIWDLSAGTASINRHFAGWRAAFERPPPIRSVRVVCVPNTAYFLPLIVNACIERSPSAPRQLDLRLHGARSCHFITFNIPSLVHLHLENYFPTSQCAISSLTTLFLKRHGAWKEVTPIEVFCLLERAPRLTTAVLHSVLGIADDEDPELNYPSHLISLPTLQSLEIHDRFPSITRALACLEMPHLRQIILTDDYLMSMDESLHKTDHQSTENLYAELARSAFANAIALPVFSLIVRGEGDVSITRRADVGADRPGLAMTISRPDTDLLSQLLQILDPEDHHLHVVTDFEFAVTGEENVKEISNETGEDVYTLASDYLAAVLQDMPHLRSLSIQQDAVRLGLLALHNFPELCPELAELTVQHISICDNAKCEHGGGVIRLCLLATIAESRAALDRLVFVYCVLEGRNLQADDIAGTLAKRGRVEYEADAQIPLGFLREISVVDHRRSMWKREADGCSRSMGKAFV